MSKGPAICLAICILIVTFFISDCASGRVTHDEATVNGRYYKPPWTETTITSDGDGGIDIDTIDHPEEWHTTVNMSGTSEMRDFNAGKLFYFTLTNGQFVTIKAKQGKWTGIKYLGEIEP